MIEKLIAELELKVAKADEKRNQTKSKRDLAEAELSEASSYYYGLADALQMMKNAAREASKADATHEASDE